MLAEQIRTERQQDTRDHQERETCHSRAVWRGGPAWLLDAQCVRAMSQIVRGSVLHRPGI